MATRGKLAPVYRAVLAPIVRFDEHLRETLLRQHGRPRRGAPDLTVGGATLTPMIEIDGERQTLSMHVRDASTWFPVERALRLDPDRPVHDAGVEAAARLAALGRIVASLYAATGMPSPDLLANIERLERLTNRGRIVAILMTEDDDD